jgi:hypothetical protein
VLRVGLETLRSQDDRNGSSGTKDAASRVSYQTQCLEVEKTTYILSYIMGRQLRFSLPASERVYSARGSQLASVV